MASPFGSAVSSKVPTCEGMDGCVVQGTGGIGGGRPGCTGRRARRSASTWSTHSMARRSPRETRSSCTSGGKDEAMVGCSGAKGAGREKSGFSVGQSSRRRPVERQGSRRASGGSNEARGRSGEMNGAAARILVRSERCNLSAAKARRSDTRAACRASAARFRCALAAPRLFTVKVPGMGNIGGNATGTTNGGTATARPGTSAAATGLLPSNVGVSVVLAECRLLLASCSTVALTPS
mmetsp:Transcript_15322/g.47856  ORF Transcript_15322/g.47856 Transcript_15322/m.47856 type:complete len:237 (+) Transcript_15322:1017-1727(+)